MPSSKSIKTLELKAVVRLPDPKLKTLGERGIECIFVGYAQHSKAFRFSSVPIPSLSIPKGTKDIGGSVVPEKVTEEDDPKTFDEAMKSKDVAFWKEAINDKMDSIMGNNTWVLADLPPAFLNGELDEEVYMNQPQGFIMPGNENKDMVKADIILGIRIKHESNGIEISQSHYIEKVLKKFNYFDCTPVSTPMDTSEKLMPNNLGKLSSYFDSFDIPFDFLSVLMIHLIFIDNPFDLIFAIMILLILLFVSSHGGTMTMSLMHQWHDTICGGVIGLRRSLLYGAYGCILGTLFRAVQVIFDEKKLGSSLEVSLDDSWRTI
ncbi:zinc finger, CCHC-type containing protein [Tanacetum coccineum]|uniref:Zinc finger, CCHC-type containing protein n=1 Tax=Tanacetum coccineum TaxID=301880 RepID=A0ABQ5CC30_9ASTR